MKKPKQNVCHVFYCAPEKEASEVDLSTYDNLQQLDLEGCTQIRIKNDFIPSMVKLIDVSNTSIERLDLRTLKCLEQLNMDNVKGLVIVDDFIPPSTNYIQACGDTCKHLRLNPVVELEEVRFTSNFGLYIDEKMPEKLSVFDAEGVNFETIDFTACKVIFVVCINSGVCLFDNVEMLEFFKIGNQEFKLNAAKEFAKASQRRQ